MSSTLLSESLLSYVHKKEMTCDVCKKKMKKPKYVFLLIEAYETKKPKIDRMYRRTIIGPKFYNCPVYRYDFFICSSKPCNTYAYFKYKIIKDD